MVPMGEANVQERNGGTVMPPRVSVVMAVKNFPEKDVKAAISSILNQDFHDLEFIIVDYGSDDDHTCVLWDAIFLDPRVNVIFYPGLTFTEALNVGVSVSTGEFIARQDADDLSTSNRLEKQVQYLDDNPGVAVLGTGYRMVNEVTGRSWPESFELDHQTVVELTRFGSPFAHGTLMVRSEVFDDFSYDELMACAQDYGLYLKIIHGSDYRFFVMPDVLYIRFHTATCVTETRKGDQDMYVGYAKERYGLGHARRHERMAVHVETYWRSPDRVKKFVAFIVVAFYDYRYWIAEYRKAQSRRPTRGHY